MAVRKRLANRRAAPGGLHPHGYAPRLTLATEGAHEVYRLARFLEMAGLKNGAWVVYHQLGLRILASMDAQEPGIVSELAALIGPERVTYRGRRRPKPVQLALGITAGQLEQLEEAVR